LIIVSFYSAIKLNEDYLYKDTYYAKLGGFSIKNLGESETEFLSNINYDIFVSSLEYFEYYSNIL